MKTMSILGIIFSVIFFFWFLLFVTSGDAISKEEFSLVGIFFGLWSIAFSIVCIVSSNKNKS